MKKKDLLKVAGETLLFKTSPTLFFGKKAYELISERLAANNDEKDDEDDEDYYDEKCQRGLDLYEEEKYGCARECFIIAMLSSYEEIRNIAKQNYKECTDILIDLFNEDGGFTDIIDFEDRQFILIVRDDEHIAGCVDEEGIINWTFTQKQYPQDIEFSTGRPQPNTLYVAHPVKTNIYIPFEKSEEYLLCDKVNELSTLVQSLGAIEISIRSLRGLSVSHSSELHWGIEANGEYDEMEASASYRNDRKKNSSRNLHSSSERVQKFAPMYAPFIPEDLVWLDTDETWKTMVNQRIKGNLLHHSIKVSATESSQISSNTAHDVKASFSSMLCKANIHFEYSKTMESCYSEETEWEISIDFADKTTLNKINPDSIRPIDKPFSMKIEDVFDVKGHGTVATGRISTGRIYKNDKVYIIKTDGEILKSSIGGVEIFRKLLDQAEEGDNVGLLLEGIKHEEIESGDEIIKASEHPELGAKRTPSSTMQVSESERQYVDALKGAIQPDGSIPDNMRSLLETIRKMSNISIARAKELEGLIYKPELSPEEQEYLDNYKSVLNNGVVPTPARGLLETIRTMKGISKERAKEIEGMA